MKKRENAAFWNKFSFWALAIVCIAVFPSRQSLVLFLLAALVCPMEEPKHWVDEILKCYSQRWIWILVCAVVLCLLYTREPLI